MYPTLFISHGAPNIILGDSYTKKNLREFAKTLEKPKYIIVFSAHYLSAEVNIIDYKAEGLMYDFYGFEKELYKYQFEIKSDEQISHKICEKLKESNIDIKVDTNRKTYDHGVWSCLAMMYDKVDIPIIQISIPKNYTEKQLINLGSQLQTFKDEAMIICSGAVTHNISDMSSNTHIKKYAKDFNDYILESINTGNEDKLLKIKNTDIFYQNHPSDEHFLPLYIAFGSAINKKGHSFNHEMTYSNLSMECFIFDR